MGIGLRPGAKAPDEPPTPYRLRASPRLYKIAGRFADLGGFRGVGCLQLIDYKGSGFGREECSAIIVY